LQSSSSRRTKRSDAWSQTKILVYSPSDLIIREASIADHQAISLLHAQVEVLHAYGRPDAFQEPPQPRSTAFLQERLAEADAAMHVADIGGAVVGYAFVKLGRPPDDAIHRPRVFAYVEEVAVSSDHRRLGVGKALMQGVEGWARDRKVDQIELTVWEFNDEAMKFYESLGYATSYRRMFRT
jgi:ribosomal protein S18 acetylase RimI-like enzyme